MRQNFSSENSYEAHYGYSRMVRVGDALFLSGHVGYDDAGIRDAAFDQAATAMRALEATLAEAGANLRHVVRTMAFVTDAAYIDDVARAHREAFGAHRPAATVLVVAGLALPELKVEIQADALLTA